MWTFGHSLIKLTLLLRGALAESEYCEKGGAFFDDQSGHVYECSLPVQEDLDEPALALLQTSAYRVRGAPSAESLTKGIKRNDHATASRDATSPLSGTVTPLHYSISPFDRARRGGNIPPFDVSGPSPPTPSPPLFVYSGLATILTAFFISVVGFLVIYEVLLSFGEFDVDEKFDLSAARWAYWCTQAYGHANLLVCLPVSLSLAEQMGQGPAMSGLLVTVTFATQVLGLRIGKAMTEPWDQAFIRRSFITCTLAVAFFQLVWTAALLSESFVAHPLDLFWLLLLTRAGLGFGIGMMITLIEMVAIRSIPKEQVNSVLSVGSSCASFGLCAGLSLSPLTLIAMQLFGIQHTVYQTSAVSAAILVVLGLLLSLPLFVSLALQSLTTSAEPDPEPVYPASPALKSRPAPAQDVARENIVFNALLYSYQGGFSSMGLLVGSSMILQLEYGFNLIGIAAILIGANAFVPVLQDGLATMLHFTDDTSLMVSFGVILLPCGVFLFNFGSWIPFSTVVFLILALLSHATSFVNGMLKASVPASMLTSNNYSIRSSAITACGQFCAGPAVRGLIGIAGRNAYASLQIVVFAVAIFIITRICRDAQVIGPISFRTVHLPEITEVCSETSADTNDKPEIHLQKQHVVSRMTSADTESGDTFDTDVHLLSSDMKSYLAAWDDNQEVVSKSYSGEMFQRQRSVSEITDPDVSSRARPRSMSRRQRTESDMSFEENSEKVDFFGTSPSMSRRQRTESDISVEDNSEKVDFFATSPGFLIANLLVGVGIFTTPYGFVFAGWAAVPIVVLSSGIAFWTATLIGDLIDVINKTPLLTDGPRTATYFDVIQMAFGQGPLPWYRLFNFCQGIFAGVYMINISSSSWEASLGLDGTLMVWFDVAFCLLLTLVPRKYYSIVGKIGTFLTISAIAIIVVSGLSLLPNRVDTKQSLFGQGTLSGVFGCISAVFIACADHICYPNIYLGPCRSNKETYKKGMAMGYSIFCCACLALCIPLYFTLGTAICPNALTNIGHGISASSQAGPAWSVVARVANGIIAFRILFIVPFFTPPITHVLDNMLGSCFGIDLEESEDRETLLEVIPESKVKFSLCLFSRALAFAIIGICSVCFYAIMGVLMTIFGSVFISVNAIIIPCAACLILLGDELNSQPIKKLLLTVVLGFGLVWCVVGSSVGIIDAVRAHS